MSLGFGYNSFIAIGDESAYGTSATITNYIEILDESLSAQDGFVAKPTIRNNSQSRKVGQKNMVSGDIKCQVGYTGLEKMFKHALGSSNVTGSGTYTHVITCASVLPTGMNVEVHESDSQIGTAYSYLGCQVSKLTLSQQAEDFLQATFSIVGQDEILVSAVTPTFPTFTGVEWKDCTVSINASSTYKVRSWEMTLDNSPATDRHYLGNPLFAGLGRGGKRTCKWKIQAELANNALGTLYSAGTSVPLLIQYATGALSFEILSPAAIITKCDRFAKSGPLLVDIEADTYISASANDELQITIINTTAGPD